MEEEEPCLSGSISARHSSTHRPNLSSYHLSKYPTLSNPICSYIFLYPPVFHISTNLRTSYRQASNISLFHVSCHYSTHPHIFCHPPRHELPRHASYSSTTIPYNSDQCTTYTRHNLSTSSNSNDLCSNYHQAINMNHIHVFYRSWTRPQIDFHLTIAQSPDRFADYHSNTLHELLHFCEHILQNHLLYCSTTRPQIYHHLDMLSYPCHLSRYSSTRPRIHCHWENSVCPDHLDHHKPTLPHTHIQTKIQLQVYST